MNPLEASDYINYRIKRAQETLTETQVLLANQFWNTSVNRMYYACFYAVSALLVKHGVFTSSHTGARQKFGQLFVNAGLVDKSLGRHYSELFDKRQRGDYADFFDIDKDTAQRLYAPSVELVEAITKLVRE